LGIPAEAAQRDQLIARRVDTVVAIRRVGEKRDDAGLVFGGAGRSGSASLGAVRAEQTVVF
jgi:hypothetical protein